MNPLFQAHCPQRGYLTKLCDHSYCSILSVAELRRSPDQSSRRSRTATRPMNSCCR